MGIRFQRFNCEIMPGKEYLCGENANFFPAARQKKHSLKLENTENTDRKFENGSLYVGRWFVGFKICKRSSLSLLQLAIVTALNKTWLDIYSQKHIPSKGCHTS